MRDILVYADNFAATTAAMDYAARLAAIFEGRVTGVYICPPLTSSLPPYYPPQLLSAVVEELRELETRAASGENCFVERAHELSARKAAWQVATGPVPDVLAHLGNTHDVVVLGRDSRASWGTPPMLGSAVLGSRMPCIVVPPGYPSPPRFDCIVLAWNGSAEALRAIHAARPMLARARRIVVLAGEPHERFTEIGWKPEFRLSAYLEKHDLRFEERSLEASQSDAGKALLEAAADYRADLLVMGAYGRTRFSEWIFGGATRHVLSEAPIPVLLRH